MAQTTSDNTLTVPVSANDHIQGDLNAPVVLVEYGDYECSYCGQAFPLIKAAQAKMGKQLCFVFRNFPLTDIHPNAAQAAEAAEDANAQGKFWQMHDMLYENQAHLEDGDLVKYAGKLGLNTREFSGDLEAGKSSDKIQNDFEGGVESGVNGTPGFFINGSRFDGDWQGDGLLEALQNA